MTSIEIRPYKQGDEAGIADLILSIQRGEFGIAITAQEQPDLADISGFYFQGKGTFLVAEAVSDGSREIVGTIALKNIGDRAGALRKMFVASDYRGRGHGVAVALLAALLHHARNEALSTIYLGTTDRFVAAHRFYEKHGFQQIDSTDLPATFPRMAVDTRFFKLVLGSA